VLSPRRAGNPIGDSFAAYGRHTPLRHTVIFGGVGQKPAGAGSAARAWIFWWPRPGRLLDLMGQGLVVWTGSRVSVWTRPTECSIMGLSTTCGRNHQGAACPNGKPYSVSATMPLTIRNSPGHSTRSGQSGGRASGNGPFRIRYPVRCFLSRRATSALCSNIWLARPFDYARSDLRRARNTGRTSWRNNCKKPTSALTLFHGQHVARGRAELALRKFKSGTTRV